MPRRAAKLSLDSFSHCGDIGSVIPVFRDRGGLPAQLQIARIDRRAEEFHLPPRVVDVVLTGDVVADRFQQTNQRLSDRCSTAMPDMQRAGWIGTDILHLHPTTPSKIGCAVGSTGRLDFFQYLLPQRRLDGEVHESGPDDLHPFKELFSPGKIIDNDLRDVVWRSLL
jgi:hypothetical protein